MTQRPVLVIFKGLPGCGKSTLAASLQSDRTIITNRDWLRHMMFGRYSGLSRVEEEAITWEQHFVARKAIREGRNVITDDTNLNPSVEAAWRKLAREEGADVQVVDLTNVPVATCIERDNKRKAEGQRFVGAEVINKMAERWLKK